MSLAESQSPKHDKEHTPLRNEIVLQSKTPPYLRVSDYPYSYCYCEENIYKMLEKLMLMQLVDTAKRQRAAIGGGPVISLKDQSIASQFDCMYAIFLSSCDIDPAQEVENDWTSLVPIRVSTGNSSDASDIGEDCCVCFDYHVIALLRHLNGRDWFVADFDSKFNTYPEDPVNSDGGKSLLIPAEEYFEKAFNFKELIDMDPIPTKWDPYRLIRDFENVRCRIIPAKSFLTYFRSDRSHMFEDGEYIMPPPTYPLINGPSPVVAKLHNNCRIKEFRPEFGNLICSFVNMNAAQGNEMYIGEVVKPSDLGKWITRHSNQ
eukprot:Tbor_TRINITY_DN5966_c2_g1::TRINITY_DN5966_c2_g1_i1::g.18346::m.18346/K21286/NTAQ1; protein N-terminal glutamine amidohydrolase